MREFLAAAPAGGTPQRHISNFCGTSRAASSSAHMSSLGMSALALTALLVPSASALRLPAQCTFSVDDACGWANATAAGALLSTALLVAPVSAATIQETTVNFADASYPIVKNLKAKQVSPLATKLVNLGITGNPTEIIKTIDYGLDAFLSVPPERFFAAARALKIGTAQASVASKCELICMPSVDNVERFASSAGDALAVTPPVKLKAFVLQAVKSLQSGDSAQYAGVVAEATKFFASLDQSDLSNVKTAGVQVLLATGSDATGSGFMPPANQAPPNKEIQAAAMKLADALYPVVSNLKAKETASLATKIVGLAISGNPTEIIKTIDAGLDAFVTVSPTKFFNTAKALKAATASASKATSCNLVCMPSVAEVEKVAEAGADALAVADPVKLQAFVVQAAKSLQSGDKLLLAGVIADGGKFASALNPADVSKAAGASIELLQATGAPADVTQAAGNALNVLTKFTG